MKKINCIVLVAIFVTVFSCKKDQAILPLGNSNSNQEDDYLEFKSEEEYSSKLAELDNLFYPSNEGGLIENNKRVDLKKEQNNEPFDFESVAIDKIIKERSISNYDIVAENERIVSSIIKERKFTSMLDIYNKSLLINDFNEMSAFVKKYSNFLTIIPTINRPSLKYSKSFASLLNADGFLMIDNKFYQKTEETINVFESDKKTLIKSIKTKSRSEGIKDVASNKTTINYIMDSYRNNAGVYLIAYPQNPLFVATIQRDFEQRFLSAWGTSTLALWGLNNGQYLPFIATYMNHSDRTTDNKIVGPESWLLAADGHNTNVVSDSERLKLIGDADVFPLYHVHLGFWIEIIPGAPIFTGEIIRFRVI